MNIIRANYGRFSIAICNIHGKIPTLLVKKELNVVSDVAADNFYNNLLLLFLYKYYWPNKYKNNINNKHAVD